MAELKSERDTWSTEWVICPYCRHECRETCKIPPGKYHCKECGGLYELEIIEVYSTSKIRDDADNPVRSIQCL